MIFATATKKPKILLYILFLIIFLFSLGFATFFLSRNWTTNNAPGPSITPTRQQVNQAASDNILIVLISLDGLGGEYLNEENSPYLYSLLTDNTSATSNAQTIFDAETLPAHVSMFTGLTQEHHGISFNFVTLLTPTLDKETLFDYAEDNSFSYYSIVTKEKLLFLMAGKSGDNIQFVNERSSGLVPILDDIVNPSTDNTFVFIHLIDLDQTGHASGWGSTDYIEALHVADANVKAIVEDFDSEFANYTRYYIITADHSGDGKSHGPNCPKCLRIPLIVISSDPAKRFVFNKPGSDYKIYDNACIVLQLMQAKPVNNLDCSI